MAHECPAFQHRAAFAPEPRGPFARPDGAEARRGARGDSRLRLLHPISDDEVVALFLRAELDSGRYGEKLSAILARDGREANVLRHPDLDAVDDNAYRRQLLDEHRAYERREGLFLDFPREIDWFRAVLDREELLDILYINWDWWLRITAGSRRPRDAARRIRAGEVAGATAEEHEPVAVALRSGVQPELIAVATPARSPIVLVEGHVRLTAYALFPEHVPPELEIVLGISEAAADWCQF